MEIVMRLRHVFASLIVASSSVVFAADTYKIDQEHGTVIYRVSHAGVGNAYGRFNKPSGEVVYDKDDPSKTTFNFEVKTDNVDTANAKRDAHLKSPDFFDTKQFPTITFKSTSVKAAGDNKLEVTGDLTLHGVTKSITVPVTKTGEADVSAMKMGYRTGWEVMADLKRSDFGMNKMVGPVGDDVHLVVSFEAVKQ
jgi:polyisoprenoid-binding protein YceI